MDQISVHPQVPLTAVLHLLFKIHSACLCKLSDLLRQRIIFTKEYIEMQEFNFQKEGGMSQIICPHGFFYSLSTREQRTS